MSFPPAAQEELEAIISMAFGIEGGYRELNGITLTHMDYNLFEELGLDQNPMNIVIGQLWLQLVAEGKELDFLKALFLGLPGNFQLRQWIRSNKPEFLELISEADFLAAQKDYENDRLDRRVRAVTSGLEQIAAGAGLSQETRKLALRIIHKLQDLTEYKTAHDVLHGLQMGCLAELLRISSPDIRDMERVMSLRGQKQVLELAREKFGQLFREDNSPPHAGQRRDLLVTSLTQILDLLNAQPNEDPETAMAAAGLLRSLLRQQMSLFDHELIKASEQIPFAEFAELMRELPGQPEPDDHQNDARPIGDIGTSVLNLEQRLIIRRTVHGLWQQVEATLLNIEELLGGVGRDVEREIHWRNLRMLITSIADETADQEIVQMVTFGDIGINDPADVAKMKPEDFAIIFGHIARESRTRFQRADHALLEDCGQMKRLHQPLTALVGE